MCKDDTFNAVGSFLLLSIQLKQRPFFHAKLFFSFVHIVFRGSVSFLL